MKHVQFIKSRQYLGTIFRYYFLCFFLKILLCGFFLMDRSVFFKLSSYMTKFKEGTLRNSI